MQNAALILCGGFSERMGRDKASLPFGDETMLERIAAVVQPCVDEVHLVAREGQEIPSNAKLGLPVARDPAEGNGPLAGLAAGLRAITPERAFVVSCDVPLLEADLVRGLFATCKNHRAVIPRIDGHFMTTCAVYSKTLVEEIDQMLLAGERRPRAIAQTDNVLTLDEHDVRAFDPNLRSFVDCNTRERLEEALEMAGLVSHG